MEPLNPINYERSLMAQSHLKSPPFNDMMLVTPEFFRGHIQTQSYFVFEAASAGVSAEVAGAA